MKNADLAKRLVELLGGKENIVDAENCMTRLRVTIKDRSKVRGEDIKNTEDVMAFMDTDEHYVQIVLGPGKVRDVMAECRAMGISEKTGAGATGDWQANKAAVQGRQNKNVVSKLRVIADIFNPMIPAFIAGGICNGFGRVIKILMANGTIPTNTFTTVSYNLIALIGVAFLSYLAIFTGVNAAKQFGVSPMLGGMIGTASTNAAISTIATTLGWVNEEVAAKSILAPNAGGIIGVVVGVWVLAQVEKRIHKIMPSALDITFTPLLSMLIVMPIFVLMVMPVTGIISVAISNFLNMFIMSDNIVVSIITGYLMAALFLPLVLFGLHRGLTPLYTLQIEAYGGTSLFPAVAQAGAGQVGAALALLLKARRVGNDRLRNVIAGGLPAGILGIGEPLIYGVTLPMMKPFITAGLGAGFGGAYVMAMHVMTASTSPSGILAVTHTLPEYMLHYVIGILISYVAGAIITYFAISDDEVRAA